MYKGDILDLLVHYKNYHLLPPKKLPFFPQMLVWKIESHKESLFVQHTNPDMQLKFLSWSEAILPDLKHLWRWAITVVLN